MGGWAPFGKKKLVKHRYCETISINTGAGYAGDYVFLANSLYDPNVTGTGHQPYGFDTMTTLYDHYTVIGSKCIVTVANGLSIPVYTACLLRDNDGSLSGADLNVLREQPGGSFRLLTAAAGASSRTTFTKRFSAKKFFGRGKGFLNDPEMKGTATTNPAEGAYFHCLIIPQNGTDDPGTVYLQIQIDYVAVWTEPKILAQS